MLCSMLLISPNFDVKSIIIPDFGQGPFPKIAGKKSPGIARNQLGNILGEITKMVIIHLLLGFCFFLLLIRG